MKLRFLVAGILILATTCFAQEQGTDEREWKTTIREDLYSQYQAEIREHRLDPARMQELNERIIEETERQPEIYSSVRASHLNLKQAREMLRYARKHPIIGEERHDHYDPEGELGFCFGRAAFMHLELLRRGVQKEAIQKAFIVGEMHAYETVWQFHVTTIVRGPDGEWLALDPNFTEPPTLTEWYKHYSKFSPRKDVRLFVTHPSKIGPSGWEYNIQPGGLEEHRYRGYFVDLFRYFKDVPVEKSYKKDQCRNVHNAPMQSPKRRLLSRFREVLIPRF